MDRRPVLITGAAGFIGYHLVGKLLEQGRSVVGLDNLNNYYGVALKKARLERLSSNPNFTFERLDLTDYHGVRTLFEALKPRTVVHLAAQAGVRHSIEQPRSYVDANLDGFLSILEACRAATPAHLIYASSSSVYGTNAKVPFAENDPVEQPVSLYAASKRANELMARSYAWLYGIPASGLRFFTVYGPFGRPDMAYYSFTKAILEGRPIQLFNEGRALRDFTYIDDIVAGICGLLDKSPSGDGPAPLDAGGAPHAIYNIGNNRPVELERFVSLLEDALGQRAVREYLPAQPGDVPATYADITRIERTVGFRPSTSLEEGLARFVAWYRSYEAGARAPARVSSMKPASTSP
ncbi:SDR family NAD(P)-dependent oxidoreductase [Aureimonas mangrovi]|uniref:SDR family NAD(P)-dependent oxidoreductase n=1 Tax=Aureimonas mangrovi TaxID=2758041 RepID=UPI00163DC6F3|nr:SDR family NAD(P)-dependent oxidoreductase [Aureimonas mangrovi]